MNKPTLACLLVPALETGRGGGHLKRLINLKAELMAQGRQSWLFSRSESAAQLQSRLGFKLTPDEIYSGDPAHRNWGLIFLDRFFCPTNEYRYWRSLAPIIAIDEANPLVRRQADYLVDLLPRPGQAGANVEDPGLIPSQRLTSLQQRRSFYIKSPVLKVLVSFGAEDRRAMTRAVVASLAANANRDLQLAVTVIKPVQAVTADKTNRQVNTDGVAGINWLNWQPDLQAQLAAYDLVITHFGLTAFEALRAATPVLLASPTLYHERLARHAGFASLGGKQTLGRRLPAYLNNWSTIAEASAAVAKGFNTTKRSLVDLVPDATFPGLGRCPLCHSSTKARRFSPQRFIDRSYFRCAGCGLIYQVRSRPSPISYDQSYFLESYADQYGQSYLDDFPKLEAMACRRLRRIKGLIADKAVKYLDIGCALGPALVAAGRLGWQAYGIDVADSAIQYARDSLGLAAKTASFPACDPCALFGLAAFDVVSLWYVIEHIAALDEALSQLNRCLRLGGCLAISTPSASGVSGRFKRRQFLAASPPDHITIWEPARTSRLLARYGFRLRKIVVTGHHPERFPVWRRWSKLLGWQLEAPVGLSKTVLLTVSRVFGLGDTFEVYAIKTRELSL